MIGSDDHGLLDQPVYIADDSFSDIVTSVFDSFPSKFPDLCRTATYLRDSAKDWVDILERLELLPLHKKMGYDKYVRIDVIYTGSSDLAMGVWLSMVERRLQKLEHRKWLIC